MQPKPTASERIRQARDGFQDTANAIDDALRAAQNFARTLGDEGFTIQSWPAAQALLAALDKLEGR